MKKFALVLAVIMMATCFAVSANAADGAAVAATADLYISFDEEIKDDIGSHTVTVVGDIPLVEGHAGTAGQLVSDYGANIRNIVELPDLQLDAGSFTISFWTYMNSTEVWGDTVFFGNCYDNDLNFLKDHGFTFVNRGSYKHQYNLYQYCNSEEYGCAGAEQLTMKYWEEGKADLVQKWSHYVIVFDRSAESSSVKIYQNGELKTEEADFSIYSRDGHDFDRNDYPWRIGCVAIQDGHTEDELVDWCFDEFYVFKKALTEEEVLAMYTYVPEVEDETDADTTIDENVDNGDAPQTFDFAVIAAVAAIVSAAGYAISKKR